MECDPVIQDLNAHLRDLEQSQDEHDCPRCGEVTDRVRRHCPLEHDEDCLMRHGSCITRVPMLCEECENE